MDHRVTLLFQTSKKHGAFHNQTPQLYLQRFGLMYVCGVTFTLKTLKRFNKTRKTHILTAMLSYSFYPVNV